MNPLTPLPRRAALALVLAALAGAGLAAPPGQEIAAALTQFQQAMAGDKAAIDSAASQLERLSQVAPQDPVLRAYAGAATSLQATTTWLPWHKIAFAEDGLAQIDQALAQLNATHDAPAHRGVPASLETRFVAASTFLGLPAMFNRRDRGARLLAEVLASPLLEQAPLGFRATVWLRAARQEPRPEQARALLQRVAVSGAPQAAAAQALLKDLP